MNILDYVRIETSTRKDGNMDYRFGDKQEIEKRREEYWRKKDFKIENTYLIKTNPKVFDMVKVLKEKPQQLTECDGYDSLVTNNPNVVLGLFTADCLQITAFDPKNKVLALIHSGFRWQDAGMIDKTFKIMKEEFGTNPKDVLIHLGNCIAPEYYRWDENILKTTNKNSWIHKTLEKDNHPERPYKIDLRRSALLNLKDIGILEENIIDSNIDCYTNKNYFSHVRSIYTKEKDGRHLTLVKIR
jgi:copper oxidase (laccase) domain-containing protein